MSHPAAPLLAEDLHRLQHTNKRGEVGMISLPGFNTVGMSEEQIAEQAGPLALGISEAIIETLTKHGYPPTHKTDIKARIDAAIAAATSEGPSTIELLCNRCQRPVVRAKTSPAKVSVRTMVDDLSAHLETCQ